MKRRMRRLRGGGVSKGDGQDVMIKCSVILRFAWKASPLLLAVIMDLEGIRLCFPQFPNASCMRPDPPDSEAVLVYLLLYFMSLLTAALNLVVIISISHFRQTNASL